MKFEKAVEKILHMFDIVPSAFIARGDQSVVYRISDEKIVKIFRSESRIYLESLRDFERLLSEYHLPFDLPMIYEINSIGETYFTVENELKGSTLSKLFPGLTAKQKAVATKNYFNALKLLHQIKLPSFRFGQVLETEDRIASASWSDFLIRKLDQRARLARDWLAKDVTHVQKKLFLLKQFSLTQLGKTQKCLAHGDYFYNNVLFDNQCRLTAILDFSNATVIGDFRMDIACAIIFFDLDPHFANYLYKLAAMNYGKDITRFIKYYQLYYAFYLVESYLYNKGLYKWCVRSLNDKRLWEGIKH
jgi:aminoglycoside phosphotransferase (APT) family kinase protein